ncbi:MAG: NAD(P)-dependent glycerol-3-phosphate dehydrogenase [Coriobacteriales bacterium]|jgi:glycerol-3-phosphate dehydrogenase (NAD(P)+)|nr:NAD(P)-dependent glycerol-3-phosphate dehydrogenase [Coriobacteriales bacterium]
MMDIDTPKATATPRVAVIGAGSWGSAIAWLLGSKGTAVTLWSRDQALVDYFNSEQQNPRYLSDIVFPANVQASADLQQSLSSADAAVLVTPSMALAEMAERLRDLVSPELPLIILSKGLDPSSLSYLDETLARAVGHPERIAVLSGPNHAEEVCKAIPAATVVASKNATCAQFFQELLATPTFRVYNSDDTIGVQLCGATKNVIAIACGLASGLGLGDNTQAMLMTRGLAEIARLVKAAGGQSITCMGLAGMGDLIATCTSTHSRNRSFGLELAGGGSLKSYQDRTHMVVEGALAAQTVSALAAKYQVELPICEQVRSIVWEDQPIDQAFHSLINRDFKPEFY